MGTGAASESNQSTHPTLGRFSKTFASHTFAQNTDLVHGVQVEGVAGWLKSFWQRIPHAMIESAAGLCLETRVF